MSLHVGTNTCGVGLDSALCGFTSSSEICSMVAKIGSKVWVGALLRNQDSKTFELTSELWNVRVDIPILGHGSSPVVEEPKHLMHLQEKKPKKE